MTAPGNGPDKQRRLRRKSLIFAALAVFGNVSGNALLHIGMQQIGPTLSISPLVYLRVFRNPYVDSGVLLLILWFLSNLFLLSWADLSYVLPVTAIGYALAGLSGWELGESVSSLRGIGIVLITSGAIVVARTKPRTTPADEVTPAT